MKSSDAVQRLKFHAGAEPGAFLEMLRPWKGLREEVLRDVEACLQAVAPELGRPIADRELVSALWAICYLGRSWAVDPDGMLRRNNLISNADLDTVTAFIDKIGYAIMMLLEGQEPGVAFEAF